jgi:hypothetical protein
MALVPDWYRNKAKDHITVITDVARLLYARQCLHSGFDRAIWVDADVVVFSPSLLTVAPEIDCGYCREIWISKEPSGIVIPETRVNNAVCVFTRSGSSELDQYINDCYAIVGTAAAIENGLIVGTSFLTRAHASRAAISNVGLISPPIMEAILQNDNKLLFQYAIWQGSPIYAANLCNSGRQFAGNTPGLFDYLCHATVAKLIRNRGGVWRNSLKLTEEG